MNLFVMPPDDATWTIPAEDFKRDTERMWPGASVQLVQEPIHSVIFEVPMKHSVVWGRMRDTGQVFTFESGDFHDCATFAVWIRTLVPAEHPLIFCDEGYTYDIALRPETTPEDILRAFKIEPREP